MHLQLLAARTALAALILGAAAAAIALGGLRLGQLSDAAATNLMIPAVGLGAVALLLAEKGRVARDGAAWHRL
jgi:hypothetical protein